LTRASIDLQKRLAKEMDCRVKPGNDGNGNSVVPAKIASASRDPYAVSPKFK
jgi:hypothetical protein